MTYHTFSPALGYVQGMSDLLSPIYVVFEANEADAFWALVGMMKMMVRLDLVLSDNQENNFLRDQSGMKRQLSTLQQLIRVMDPQLYAHLGESNRSGSKPDFVRQNRFPQSVFLLPMDPDRFQA